MWCTTDTIIMCYGSYKDHQALDLRLCNTLRPRQNVCQFADDIFKFIFLYKNDFILLQIPWNVTPKVHLRIPSIGLGNGLAPNRLNRRQIIIWTNDGRVYWGKYVSINNELAYRSLPNEMADIRHTTFWTAFFMKFFFLLKRYLPWLLCHFWLTH